MPVLHQLQPSFNNGEISPLLYDRVDFQKFVSSVKSGKNMFVHPQGGMSNRAGTVMLAQAKDEVVRLIPFEFSSTETYVIEFGNGYCRFFTTNGQVVVEEEVEGQTVQVPYEIESPFSTADLDKIRYCQSGDVMYLAWGGKPKTLTRYGHTQWAFADYNNVNGPLSIGESKSAYLNKQNSLTGFNYLSFIYGGSGTSSTALASDDLSSWSLYGSDAFMYSAKIANGVLFSIKRDEFENIVNLCYSTDGVQWSDLFTDIRVNRYFQVFHDGTKYVLFDGEDKLYSFNNFTSYNTLSHNFAYLRHSTLSFQNNLFFIQGRTSSDSNFYIYYSSDAVSWTKTNINCGGYFLGNVPAFAYYNSNYYLFGSDSGSNYIAKYDSSFNSVTSFQMPRYSVGLGYGNEGEGFAVQNGKLYIPLFEINTSRYYLYSFEDNNNTFSLEISYSSGSSYSIFNYSSYAFVKIGDNSYKLNSDGSYSLLPLYASTSVNNLFPFYIAPVQDAYYLYSNDYKFSSEDIGRIFNLSLDTDSFTVSGTGSGTNSTTSRTNI